MCGGTFDCCSKFCELWHKQVSLMNWWAIINYWEHWNEVVPVSLVIFFNNILPVCIAWYVLGSTAIGSNCSFDFIRCFIVDDMQIWAYDAGCRPSFSNCIISIYQVSCWTWLYGFSINEVAIELNCHHLVLVSWAWCDRKMTCLVCLHGLLCCIEYT